MCAELGPALLQCQLIVSEMQHFVQQIQYYINFEVRRRQPCIIHQNIDSQSLSLYHYVLIRCLLTGPGSVTRYITGCCHNQDNRLSGKLEKSGKCREKSWQGKLFIVNFMYVATPAFSSIVVA